MATNTINENVEQAILDFGTIKQAIIDKGVEVPSGTHTSQYGAKIGEIQSGNENFKAVIGRTATTLTLPDGLSKIGNYSFFEYITLTSASIPESVTSIGFNAFNSCKNLVLISMPGVTSIGNNAFGSCKNLAITSLPSGVTSIGNDTFSNCTKLALTSLPEGLTSIGSSVFYKCTSLALTSLPSGITKIENNAFGYCTSLTEITFKGKPTTVYANAFSNCTNLTIIRVPWSEGEVANSPWGATNATIVYNYTSQ